MNGFNVIRTLNVERSVRICSCYVFSSCVSYFFFLIQSNQVLHETLSQAELSYSNTMLSDVSKNPYHNALHGADVMCSSAAIFSSLSETHVPSEAFSSLVIFSLGIASLLHDYKHLGVNNGFLKNFKHPLSIRFQNGAYLERMHAAEALKLIKSTSLLDTFTEQNKSAFEFLVTSLILCTDFSRGMKSVELVETAFRIPSEK